MCKLKDGQWLEGYCDDCGSEIIADCNIENYKGLDGDFIYFCANPKCKNSKPQEGFDQMDIEWSKYARDIERMEANEKEEAYNEVCEYIKDNGKDNFLENIQKGIVSHNCVEFYKGEWIKCDYKCNECWDKYLNERNKNKLNEKGDM